LTEFLKILGCSLTTVVLQLLALGVQDPLNFDFMDKPPTEVRFPEMFGQ
jgi:HrpA-like RNA helicase